MTPRKVSLCAALAVAFLALIGPAPGSADGGNVAVTISGPVSVPGFTVHVEAQARGQAAALNGHGSDTPITPPSGNNPDVCTFPLTGSVAGSVATLSGTVTFSSNSSLLGTPVTVTADASNGSIVFNFGGFILTGTGTVRIK